MRARAFTMLVCSFMLFSSLPSAAASPDGWYPQLYAVFSFGTRTSAVPHLGAQLRPLDSDLYGQVVSTPAPLQLDWVPNYRYEARIGGVPMIRYRLVVDEVSDSSVPTEQKGFFARHWLAVGAGAVGVAALSLGHRDSYDAPTYDPNSSGNGAHVCVSDLCNP